MVLASLIALHLIASILMIQISGELGLDEWLIQMLTRQVSIQLRWVKYPRDRYFVMVKLKSTVNQPKHIKYNLVIEYAKHKRKSSPEHLAEYDLERIFDEFLAELKNCSWCRFVNADNRQDSTIYKFEMKTEIKSTNVRRREQRANLPAASSLMVPSNTRNQNPEISLPLLRNPASIQNTEHNIQLPMRGSYHPESSVTSGDSNTTPTNQTSSNVGMILHPGVPFNSGINNSWHAYLSRTNISKRDLKRFEVRIFVNGRMVVNNENASLMEDGFQICYGLKDSVVSIIVQHEPEIASMLQPVGFNRAVIDPRFMIERDVKQALDAFVCGGVLFKYDEREDSVLLYRFSQTRVFVESHLHPQPQKLERFCRARQDPPTIVFSYPKYLVEGRRSTKYINLKIGSSKIRAELMPKLLDTLEADFPAPPSGNGSTVFSGGASAFGFQSAPRNVPHRPHGSFSFDDRGGN